jgi:hypothetical protein
MLASYKGFEGLQFVKPKGCWHACIQGQAGEGKDGDTALPVAIKLVCPQERVGSVIGKVRDALKVSGYLFGGGCKGAQII